MEKGTSFAAWFPFRLNDVPWKRKQTMAQIKSCGVLITVGRPVERFLLMKHPDRWDLPKGHVDPGETERECAMRELNEETGISASDVELDADFRFTLEYQVRMKRYGNRPVDKELVIFLGRLINDVRILTTEHESYQWFPWDPPHRIQVQTIDPLLARTDEFLQS